MIPQTSMNHFTATGCVTSFPQLKEGYSALVIAKGQTALDCNPVSILVVHMFERIGLDSQSSLL